MQFIRQVKYPPAKPLMLFDGECGFCRRWIVRWQRLTGNYVDYLPFQNSSVATRFPEVPIAQLETAVHLIAPDGSLYFGAEAVFRSLAFAKRDRWLKWYLRWPLFARLAEFCYRFVARHRRHFSRFS